MRILSEIFCFSYRKNFIFFAFFFLSSIFSKGFVPETSVLTMQGYVQIKDIKPGDCVLSNNGHGELVEARVVGVFTKQVEEIVEIKLDGKVIEADRDQEFRLPLEHRWREAQDLHIELLLLQHRAHQGRIASLKMIRKKAVLYELALSKYNNFYVSEHNVNVHNTEFGLVLEFAFDSLSDIQFVGIRALMLAGGVFVTFALDRLKRWHATAGTPASQHLMFEEPGYGVLENEHDYAGFYDRHLIAKFPLPATLTQTSAANSSFKVFQTLSAFWKTCKNFVLRRPQDPVRFEKAQIAKKCLYEYVAKRARGIPQEKIIESLKRKEALPFPEEAVLAIQTNQGVIPLSSESEYLTLPLQNKNESILLRSDDVQELGEQFIRALRLQKPEAPFSLGGKTAGISITSASLDKNSQVYKELEQITWVHNQSSFVQKVARYGQAALDGLVMGAQKVLDQVIEHPKEAVVNIAAHALAGKYILAYHLAKEGYKLGTIAYKRYKNPEEGKQLWKEHTQSLRDFLGHFTNSTIPVTQKITVGARLFAEWRVRNLLFEKVGLLCERVKVNLGNGTSLISSGSGLLAECFQNTCSNKYASKSDKIKPSMKSLIKKAQLPIKGKIRYVPPKGWHTSEDLPRVVLANGKRGYKDRFGNVWVDGKSRTKGQNFEWDVQLSSQGKRQLGWMTRDNEHLNVSLDGKVTHK